MTINIMAIATKKPAVAQVQAIHAMWRGPFQTRPRAKPLAMWLRTNQMTIAPGTIVRTPAAASKPQSIPSAEYTRVITATMGLA